jgi:hypothetical protein
MRALCGAIIAAGALIGLGITALGIGTRYQGYAEHEASGELKWVLFRHLDTPLMFILVLLTCCLVIGFGIAFVGLAFHHERRYWERQQLNDPRQRSQLPS